MLLGALALALIGLLASNPGRSVASATPAPQERDRIKCESMDNREQFCSAQIAGNVRISRQISDRRCVEGQNWRWRRDGITVWNGCRADFEFDVRSGGGGGYPGGGGLQTMRCESNDGRRQFCSASVRGDVRLVRQLSNARCTQGSNWGWSNTGIWVDNGCRGEFEFRGFGGGGGHSGGGGPGSGYNQRITCESNNNGYRECAANGEIRDIRLADQMSSAPCNRGSSWGVSSNRRAVWVNRGCRARFEVSVGRY